MNNIKKYIILIIILLITMLFAGCVNMDISYKITPNNIVTVKYNADINTTKNTSTTTAQLSDELRQVRNYWKSLGYDDVELDLSNTMYNISITMTIEEKCETRQEAFDTLYEIMTSEISIFDDVDYSYERNFYQENYSFNGNVDISGLLDEEEITKVYPQYTLNDLQGNFENSSFKLTFSLPHDAASDNLSMNVVSQYLPHDKSTDFFISGIITNHENIEREANTIKYKSESFKNLLTFGIPSVILLLILAFLIKYRLKSNKNNNIETTSDSDIADIS